MTRATIVRQPLTQQSPFILTTSYSTPTLWTLSGDTTTASDHCCLVVAETLALAELFRVDDVGVATANLREQEREPSTGDTAAKED